jgi:hypothetical protein
VVTAARESLVASAADGSLVASWGVSLKPGRYQVTVAGLLPDTKQGATCTLDIDVPDFAAATLVASPLVVYPDDPIATATADPRDAYASFQVGAKRLHPRFGNVFSASDSILVVATVHGAQVDGATGQASLRSRYSILKGARPQARGAEEAFSTAQAVASVGPIPLTGYEPGTYTVRLDVTDAVSGKTLRQELPFEIRLP